MEQSTRQIAEFIETKQYKKALKHCDQLLKKTPKHGEALCLKGLTTRYMGKKEESYDLVNEGLKLSPTCHVCWHVNGLLCRHDKDYPGAIKNYKEALKIDPQNAQILRDLTLLQIHERDLEGCVETRRLLSNQKLTLFNWLSLIVAEFLTNNYAGALKLLEEDTRFVNHNISNYEKSEIYMFRAHILEQMGDLDKLLEFFDRYERQIVDKLSMKEKRAQIFMSQGQFSKAQTLYRELYKGNPENHIYILCLIACNPRFQSFWPALQRNKEGESEGVPPNNVVCFPNQVHPAGYCGSGWIQETFLKELQPDYEHVKIGSRWQKPKSAPIGPLRPLTADEESEIIEFFGDLQDLKKSDSAQRLCLHFVSGERFRDMLEKFLRPRLEKGIPSLFRMLKPLYFSKPTEAPQIIVEILKSMESSLEKSSVFGEGSAKGTLPTSLLFVYLFLGEHYNTLGEYQTAKIFVKKAITFAPTMPEAYRLCSKILKDCGDLTGAAETSDEARNLDLADRYLNTRAVKAQLRINNNREAQPMMLQFSRESVHHPHGPPHEASTNLHDMQCMWYELETAKSYRRQGIFGRALRNLNEMMNHFGEIHDDQFDFHNYCLRKNVIVTYCKMLTLEDNLYSHREYRRACKESLGIYFHLADEKERQKGLGEELTEEQQIEKMLADPNISAAERKKLKNQLKRVAKKAEEKREVEKKEQQKNVLPCTLNKDEDANGVEYLKTLDPLAEAEKLVKQMLKSCTKWPNTFAYAYDLHSRQDKKLIIMAKNLEKLAELEASRGRIRHAPRKIAHFAFTYLANEENFSSQPPLLQTAALKSVSNALSSMCGKTIEVSTLDALRKTVETEVFPLATAKQSHPAILERRAALRILAAAKDTAFVDDFVSKISTGAEGSYKDFSKLYWDLKELSLTGKLSVTVLEKYVEKFAAVFASPVSGVYQPEIVAMDDKAAAA